MRTNLKRAALIGTAGLGAAALAAGFALPASADETTDVDTRSTTSSSETDVAATFDALQTWIDEITAANANSIGEGANTGNVGIDGGLVNGPLISDVGNGALLSGNDTPVLSGNEVTAPVGSGNDTSVDAPIGSGNEVGSGNDIGTDIAPEVGNGTDVGVGDIGAEVGDVTGDVGAEVGNLVGDISSDVDDLVTGILGD